MPILWTRDGTQRVLWEPTTDLMCSACREPLEVKPRTLKTVNFTFDYIEPDPLTRGEYWYLHKQCARIEDLLQVNWGWHSLSWVLGGDKTMTYYFGNLRKQLQKRMPPGIYDRLYEAWLPALKPAKVIPSRDHKAASSVVRADRLQQARVLRETRKLASRFAIMQRDQFRCRLCGLAASDGAHVRLEVDHIIPRSKGGSNDAANKWVLCFACNRGKGTTLL